MDHILREITNIDQFPVSANKTYDAKVPFSKAAVQLSNPAFYTKLPFPFVGAMPKRFNIDRKDVEKKWSYMGREKFAKLVEDFEMVQESPKYTALWVYGTKGYGKSHLLAIFVCYLVAQGKKVIYIPDCRECAKYPVLYFQVAMLFTWANDENKQREIMTLGNMKKISEFLKRHIDVIFVIDQMNGLEMLRGEDGETKNGNGKLRKWLKRFTALHKAVLSTSANNHSFHLMDTKQISEATMRVYGGLTKVSPK
jgi:hypothetical protein